MPQIEQNGPQYSSSEDPTIPECTVDMNQSPGNQSPTQCHPLFQSPCNSPQQNQPNNVLNLPIKRKRSVNPQADENFVRALEAVRFGGIGFCKAARMYGVNNRTLWLEYKKRGYPIYRPSIKNRAKQELLSNLELQPQEQRQQQEPPPPEQPTDNDPMSSQSLLVPCSPQPVDLAAFSNDFQEGIRPRFHDTTILTAAQINMQGINFS